MIGVNKILFNKYIRSLSYISHIWCSGQKKNIFVLNYERINSNFVLGLIFIVYEDLESLIEKWMDVKLILKNHLQ